MSPYLYTNFGILEFPPLKISSKRTNMVVVRTGNFLASNSFAVLLSATPGEKSNHLDWSISHDAVPELSRRWYLSTTLFVALWRAPLTLFILVAVFVYAMRLRS